MWPIRRVLKYSVLGTAVVGTAASLHANDYNLNSIGVVRLGRAALTVYDIGLTYKRKLYYREWDKESTEYKLTRTKVHLMGAEKLLQLICTNKGVYIKVGQHIGALDYLVPPEYTKTLKILHSDAPKNPVEDLYKVIRTDLKVDPADIFESFDPEPLGTASLAQVHRATLKDGREVAVKVQHPYVRGNSKVDMKTMEYLCKMMSMVFSEFKMDWLVEESKKNLPIELDFLIEGKNAEKVAEMFKDYKWLKIPKIVWELSTKRVLVMEYCPGGQVNDLDYINRNHIDRFEISNKLGQLYSNMIFVHGFVHSDPHPGNILVRKNDSGGTDIVLLDHGLYANLSNKFRYNYSKLWMSILNFDRKAMRLYSSNLGIKGDYYGLFACMVTGRPWESVMAGVSRTNTSNAEKETLQKNTSMVLPHIADILDQVDRQMLLVLKTNDLIRGIESTLKTQNRKAAWAVMTSCCIKSIYAEKYKSSSTSLERVGISIAEAWSIFKTNIYFNFYLKYIAPLFSVFHTH